MKKTARAILIITSSLMISPLLTAYAAGYVLTTTLPGTAIKAGQQSPTIAGYVHDFFVFSLVVVGVAALAMIVYQGLKYTLSAGNAGRQQDARDGIWQAIMGLVLLLAAYLILLTINPALVSLEKTNTELIGAPNVPYNNPGNTQ